MGLLSYIRLLRIRDWLAYFLIVTFGFLVSKGYAYSLISISAFYLLVFLMLGFGFSINDCFDVESDRLNKLKQNPVAKKEIEFKRAFLFSIFLALSAIALSAFFGLKVFLFCLVLSFLAFSYSSPPLRLKSRPFLDVLSHGLFFGAFLFLLPFLVFSTALKLSHYLLAFSFFYLSAILELRNHLRDYRSDKKAGLKTTVCVLGQKTSEKLTMLLSLSFPIVFFLSFYSQLSLVPFFAITLLFYLVFLSKKNYKALDVYAAALYGLLIMAL